MSAAAGMLVAVCGLAEGAGTTLLSWLLANESLREELGPVLLAELPACAGGVVALTGVSGGRSLTRLAVEPAATRAWPEPSGGPRGLRLAADVDGLDGEIAPELVVRALDAARAEHGAVVVDCGHLAAAEPAVLARASHVVWVVPAGGGAGGLARDLLLESDLAPPPGAALELVALVASQPAATLPPDEARALRGVVAERAERLVLVPHARGLVPASPRQGAASSLASSLAALVGVLRRAPTPVMPWKET